MNIQSLNIINLAACLSLVALTILPATAQPAGKQRAVPTGTRAQAPSQADIQEYKAQSIKTVVNFPNVPLYTGKYMFLSGFRYPQIKGGEHIGYSLGVNEDSGSVLDWYKSALGMYGWKVKNTTSTDTVQAVKDGNTIVVTVQSKRALGYRTVLMIGYQYGNGGSQ